MHKQFIFGLITLVCTGLYIPEALAYIVDGSRISRPRMLSYAKSKLQNQGTLEQTAAGVRLKVADSYIRELFRQIQAPGYEMPTQAQISVISENEAKEIKKLQELGQKIDFKPLGFYTIVEDDLEYFMLAVDAPALSSLRQKYGLSERIENHAFSIIIGVRPIVAHNELAPTPAG